MSEISKTAFSQLFGLPKSALYGHPLSALVSAVAHHIGERAAAIYEAAEPDIAPLLLADEELASLMEMWRSIDYDDLFISDNGTVALGYYGDAPEEILAFLWSVPTLRSMGFTDILFAFDFPHSPTACAEAVAIGRAVRDSPGVPLEYLLEAVTSTEVRRIADIGQQRSNRRSNRQVV